MSTSTTCCPPTPPVVCNWSSRYAFVLVLFILLVICGAAFWY